MESIEPARIGNELGPLRLEHLPDYLLGQFRMAVRLGVGDTLVGEPGIHLVVGLEPQSRREEALADEPHLVLDPPPLTAGCSRSGECAAGRHVPGARPAPAPSRMLAYRRPDRPGSDCTSARSGDYRAVACQRR